MSQVATQPIRSAKQIKKLKEIAKVRSAIRWHEHDRIRRHARVRERFESRALQQARIKWNEENIKQVKRQAIREAQEDWRLGPLRPNRAVGSEAELYGTLDGPSLRRPEVPVKVHKRWNEILERKGKPQVYPLVVGDEKYFSIAKGDRVVVIKGREKNKIGVVSEIVARSHEVVIKDINKHYADGSLFTAPPGEAPPVKREIDAAIPMSDVRLVVPYRIVTQTASGGKKTIFEDVIVEDVVLERHTRGMDPFTGIDHGNDQFPIEHQYDPETGVPIFNRYVAGSRVPIPWPWEKSDMAEDHPDSKDTSHTESQGIGAKVRSLAGAALHPMATWRNRQERRRAAQQSKEASQEAEKPQPEKELDRLEAELRRPFVIDETTFPPRGPEVFHRSDSDDNTGRNHVEARSETRTFVPNLVYPPFPDSLINELGTYIKEKRSAGLKHAVDPDEADKATLLAEQTDMKRRRKVQEVNAADEQRRRLAVMKTPMQLRWEVERARQEKEKPLVEDKAMLLEALGRHMANNRTRVHV